MSVNGICKGNLLSFQFFLSFLLLPVDFISFERERISIDLLLSALRAISSTKYETDFSFYVTEEQGS